MLVVGFMGAVSLWTPLLDPAIAARWFTWPNLAYLSPVPIAVAVASLALYRGIRERSELSPFILSMVLFLLGYGGLAISLWPNLVPPHVSIREAAAPPETLWFMVVGFVVLIPVILAYTAYSYWVFRGKVADEAGYH